MVFIPQCENLHSSAYLQFISKDGADYYCSYTSCPAQLLQRLKHWCETMKIKGIGESTLASLITITRYKKKEG